MMSFVSRFLSPKRENDDPETFEEMSLADGEGLFMSTQPRPIPPGDRLPEAALDAAAPSTIADEVQEPSPPPAPPPESPTPPAEPEAAPTPQAPPVQQVAAAPEDAGDDPIALFRASKNIRAHNTLTEELEETTAQELLAELRELRRQLGFSGPVAEEP